MFSHFHVHPLKSPVPVPRGKDVEIIDAVMKLGSEYPIESSVSMQQALFGRTRAPIHTSSTKRIIPALKITELRTTITGLVRSGGSLSRSCVIHAVCSHIYLPQLAMLLLEIDGSVINSQDEEGRSPLTVAARNAAAQGTIHGILDTSMIDVLLSNGVDRRQQDPHGMTAFGIFKNSCEEAESTLSTIRGEHRRSSGGRNSMYGDIEHKLYPPGGPASGDLAGGARSESGFIDYTEANREHDDFF
jgi:hypothetical protein